MEVPVCQTDTDGLEALTNKWLSVLLLCNSQQRCLNRQDTGTAIVEAKLTQQLTIILEIMNRGVVSMKMMQGGINSEITCCSGIITLE